MKNSMIFLMAMFCLSTEVLAQTVQVKQNLRFADECTSGPEVTVSAVGDILLHTPLQRQAFRETNNYRTLWPAMIPIFNRFNVSYANFEGPAAEGVKTNGQVIPPKAEMVWDESVYTGYPQFNYHPILVRDLIQSGIDVVSTANNHSLDRRALGADMTIQAMDQYGLRYTGTKPRSNPNRPWYTVTESNGFRIAWLACTFSTNGIPDKENQVLFCYEDKQEVLELVRQLSESTQFSAVIVTPHWGSEYKHVPNKKEILFGRELIDTGATVVMATHPHVIQPWEKHVTSSGREGLIVYSTGNFVSAQAQMPRRVGMMIGVKFVQDPRSAKLNIKSARFLPVLMNHSPYFVAPIEADSSVSSSTAKIWKDLYHDENRIQNLQNPFNGECGQ